MRTPIRPKLVAALLAGLLTGLANAAGVVVQPGTNAGYMYFPQGITNASGSSSTGPTETLALCRVTPTSGSRTLVMSTRNWFGYTKPITVYYKMVGGGAGHTSRWGSGPTNFPQYSAAGGSTVLMKNGSIVGYAAGMNAGVSSRTVTSGTFTVSNTDTLTMILGGGGGGGMISYHYTGTFDYYGFAGGGGSGYYGGGAGNWTYTPNSAPSPGAAVATGGTNTTGGSGGGSGGLYSGGRNAGHGNNAYGGSGTTSGSNTTYSLWSGTGNAGYQIGGGGGQGKSGLPGGDQGCLADPAMPQMPQRASSFDLSSGAGIPGYYYNQSGLNCNAGGGYGEIVLQYQAPTCDLIPQYDEN